MADTTNKGLGEPASSSTDWEIPLNSNFEIIDNAFGGRSSIDVTAVTTTQTLTIAQYRNLIITFTGTLSANLTYQVPSGIGGQWFIFNTTSGSYTLTISTSAPSGATVIVPSNGGSALYSDGTNVYQYASNSNISPRGVFGGGYTTTYSVVMDYITIATTGNATTFGNLTVARQALSGVSSATRGVFGGGTTGTVSAVMDYITIATTGNATSFGNLTIARSDLGGVSNSATGVFGGGTTGAVSAVMDYITIATTGNATTFGNLTVARYGLAGISSYIPS